MEQSYKVSMDSRVNELLTDLEGKCDKIKRKKLNKNEAPKVEISTKPKTNAEICRDNPRILGYKIQVAVVKSNEEAKQSEILFPYEIP